MGAITLADNAYPNRCISSNPAMMRSSRAGRPPFFSGRANSSSSARSSSRSILVIATFVLEPGKSCRALRHPHLPTPWTYSKAEWHLAIAEKIFDGYHNSVERGRLENVFMPEDFASEWDFWSPFLGGQMHQADACED
jgi:hypothetical protein